MCKFSGGVQVAMKVFEGLGRCGDFSEVCLEGVEVAFRCVGGAMEVWGLSWKCGGVCGGVETAIELWAVPWRCGRCCTNKVGTVEV